MYIKKGDIQIGEEKMNSFIYSKDKLIFYK